MIELNLHMGAEFQKQMKIWFKEHPEVKHKMDEDTMKIFHPINADKFIKFQLCKNSILIRYEDKETEFLRDKFKSLQEQVFRIQ